MQHGIDTRTGYSFCATPAGVGQWLQTIVYSVQLRGRTPWTHSSTDRATRFYRADGGSIPSGSTRYHVRYQAEDWSCGPASIINGCRVLGVKASERSVRSLCGTTLNGTDDDQMIAGIRALGLTATPHHSSDAPAAWAFVRSNIMEGRPSLICIDQWRHWVSLIGIVGGLVILADPVDTKSNRSENGIHSLSRPRLVRRWRCRNEDEPFYAIAMGK